MLKPVSPKEVLDGRAFQRNPLAFLRQVQTRGDVACFRAGFSRFVVLNSPDLIHRVLVSENNRYGEGKWTARGKFVMGDSVITREGDPHLQRRRLVQPAFGQKALTDSGEVIVRRTESLSWHWRARSGQRTGFDIYPDLAALALEIVGECLFAVDLSARAHGLNRDLSTLLYAIPRLPLPRPRLLAARRRTSRVTAKLARGRLIAQLREAGLNAQQIRDEVISLLIASIDTTPKTLAWVLVLLAQHKQWEADVLEEIDRVLPGRDATLDDVPRLARLGQVVQETLRLYPPVHFIDRRPLADVDLDGVTVKAGTYMLISPLLTQRDPRFFATPDAFRPERWANGNQNERPRFAFFPFGAGPHACVGKKLAMNELLLATATLLRHWRFLPSPELLQNPSPQRLSFPGVLEQRG